MNKLTTHEIIEKLAECACEGRLIIFVGAGFSKMVVGEYDTGPLKGQNRALSWIDLLLKVAQDLQIGDAVPCPECDKPIDCPQIASEMVKALYQKNTGKKSLADCEHQIKEYVCELTDWYPDKNQKKGWLDIFNAICPSTIITTNYDHVLEELLEDKAISLSSTDTLPTLCEAKFLIYHIHGVRSRPDDLVLTRQDYIEALRPFSYRQVRLTTLLRENSVLYLGYAKNDMNILSALDTAQETFSDIKRNTENLHVQIVYEKTEDTMLVNQEIAEGTIHTFLLKTSDVKNVLFDLSDACKKRREQVEKRYKESIDKLKSLMDNYDVSGSPKDAGQRHSDIVNAFNNCVIILNEPTKLGRRFAYEFDSYIKGYYRGLKRSSKMKNNWNEYAYRWALLYAYFFTLTPHWDTHADNISYKAIPYTRLFKYAIGWLNDLARFIGAEIGEANLAWDWFCKDWPTISLEIRQIIIRSTTRKGYKNFRQLLLRAGFEQNISEV